jgi:hypothetical protein
MSTAIITMIMTPLGLIVMANKANHIMRAIREAKGEAIAKKAGKMIP